MAMARKAAEIQAVFDRVVQLAKSSLDLSDEDAKARTTEYMRFMRLKARHDKPDKPSKLAPSALVDEIWHAHILDTK